MSIISQAQRQVIVLAIIFSTHCEYILVRSTAVSRPQTSRKQLPGLYVIDRDGLTLAASNWDSPAPFVGSNFAFRPYFQAAIQGQTGRYPALGTTSNKRGYYYAYPVTTDDNPPEAPLGVVVVKVGVDAIEQNWLNVPERLLVSDANGVVFISNQQNWRFRLLEALTPSRLQAIHASRQYAATELKVLNIIAQQEP